MSKLTALVLAGACVTLLAASGCNRTLPTMEPYDQYRAHFKNPGDLERKASPALTPREGFEAASAAGNQ